MNDVSYTLGGSSPETRRLASRQQCKDTKWKSVLQEKTRISSDHFRSENFALKVAKPFVSGHFSEGRKWSEIGRKIFEKCTFSIDKHQRVHQIIRHLDFQTFRHLDIQTFRHLDFRERALMQRKNLTKIYVYIFYIIYIL